MQGKSRKQVNVDFEKHPDLYRALLALEDELDTDKSKLIRNLVREKAQKHGYLQTNNTAKKVRAVTNSSNARPA